MSDELKPCPCGGVPEVMIDNAWNAYSLCPKCGRKGPEVPFPRETKMETSVFVAYLDAQRREAASVWNMEVEDER